MAISATHKQSIGTAMAARHARAREVEAENARLRDENRQLASELAIARTEVAATRAALRSRGER